MGFAEKGPISEPTLVANWTQFTRTFGGFVDGAYLPHAIYGYELTAQSEPLVRQNPSYLSIYLIMRTVSRLGELPVVDRFVIEHLFASDLAFLQDLYRRINQLGHTEAEVACPSCTHRFLVDVAGS